MKQGVTPGAVTLTLQGRDVSAYGEMHPYFNITPPAYKAEPLMYFR